MTGIPIPYVSPLMARRLNTSSDVPVPVSGRIGTLKTLAAHAAGCLVTGLNFETGQLSRHYIAEILLNVMWGRNQPTKSKVTSGFNTLCNGLLKNAFPQKLLKNVLGRLLLMSGWSVLIFMSICQISNVFFKCWWTDHRYFTTISCYTDIKQSKYQESLLLCQPAQLRPVEI